MDHRQVDAKYDILKLCLSFFIVAIHTNLWPMALYPWLRVAVPLFFMLSGYFLFSKLNTQPREIHKAIMKSFVLRNVRLYIFWFLICLPVTVILRWEEYTSGTVLQGIWLFLRKLFFGSTFMASWYISACVIGSMILYVLASRIKPWAVFLLCLLAFTAVTLYSGYLPFFSKDSLLTRGLTAFSSAVSVPTGCFLASMVWLFLGKCFAEQKIRFSAMWLIILLLAVSCAALYLEWRIIFEKTGAARNDSYFMLLPVCLCLFSCLQKLPPVIMRNSLYIRRFSTVMYALHGSVAIVINSLLKRVLPFDVSLPVFFLTLLCCGVVYLLIAVVTAKYPESKLSRVLKCAY